MGSESRCPACFSKQADTGIKERHTCALCGFETDDTSLFTHWRQHALPRWQRRDNLVITPNPNNIWRKLGLKKSTANGTDYGANAVTACLERRGIPVIAQDTRGCLGLPIPFGRWGEQVVTHTAPTGTGHVPENILTIGGICQAHEVEAVTDQIRACQALTSHFLYVVDTASEAERQTFEAAVKAALTGQELPDHLTILHHPLDGDFGRQRNLVQAAAKTDWILQLDCDEKLDQSLMRGIAWAIKRADNMVLLSVGFPRKNLVDGALSAHYPDVQYRLNHRTVRFHKPVHEAPNVPWQKVGMCWLGHIEHFLPKARLEARSRKYEQMEKGAGKPANLALLLTPFDLPATESAD